MCSGLLCASECKKTSLVAIESDSGALQLAHCISELHFPLICTLPAHIDFAPLSGFILRTCNQFALKLSLLHMICELLTAVSVYEMPIRELAPAQSKLPRRYSHTRAAYKKCSYLCIAVAHAIIWSVAYL